MRSGNTNPALPGESHRTGGESQTKEFIRIFLFFLIILIGIVLYKLVFIQTSVSFECHPAKIFVYSSEPVVVKVNALNKLGFRIPFKRLYGTFVIREGIDRINIVRKERDELVFRTSGGGGRLVVLYYTMAVPIPLEINLNIQSAAVASAFRDNFRKLPIFATFPSKAGVL